MFERIKARRDKKFGADVMAKRRTKRKKIFKGIFSVVSNIPGPQQGLLEMVSDSIDATPKGSIKTLLDSAPDVIAEAVAKSVADVDQPEFDQELGDLLQGPFMALCSEACQDLIDKLEAKGIDIPDWAEDIILESVMDQVETVYDLIEDEAEDLFDKGLEWAKNWVTKLFD